MISKAVVRKTIHSDRQHLYKWTVSEQDTVILSKASQGQCTVVLYYFTV